MIEIKDIKRCTRCVMDNSSDDTIVFDQEGVCNYCTYALKRKDEIYFPNEVGRKKMEDLIKQLKEEGKGKDYDCLMGLSGGLDSSYLAYLGYKYDLRILAFHIDDGFNTSVAEDNVRKLCEKANISLIVEKPDSEQFIDATRAFFLAGLPSLCNPQDNIIFSYLYNNARKYEIKSFLTGGNFSLESILQRGKGINAADGFHIREVCKIFGTKGLNRLPIMSLVDNYIMSKYRYKLKKYRPLDYIDYNRDKAIKELNEFCDFNYYGGKHYENILTHFTQAYYLPQKFGVDKRTSHLSSMIISDQLTRDEALLELEKPLFEQNQIDREIKFLSEKFEISVDEFHSIMANPARSHFDYPHSTLNKFASVARVFRKHLF